MAGRTGLRRNAIEQPGMVPLEHTPDPDAPKIAATENPADHREFSRVAIGKRAELRIEGRAVIPASIANLNLGGLLVRCEEQLPVATPCEITIFLVEGDSTLQIRARGTVVRTDPWGMALKFSKVLGLDSLQGLHNLVLYNTPDPAKAEREFQTHQSLRQMGSAARLQGRWGSGGPAPLWLRRTKAPPRPRWKQHYGPRTRRGLNPVHEQVLARIEALPDEMKALRTLCRKYLQYCSALDESVCLIGHRSWEAPLDYLIELFPPAKKAWFQTYRKLHGITIPRQLHSLLCACNGFTLGEFCCYGIPPSMLCTPPTLDENTWQPFDIGTATTDWILDFPKAQGMTYFAGGPWSDGDTVGYFMDEERILAMRSGGEILGTWSGIEPFLDAVLAENDRMLTESIPSEWWR